MDSPTLSALEFGSMKQLLHTYVRTPFGRKALEELSPSSDPGWIRERKDLAEEAIAHHLEGERLGPGSLEDPADALRRLRPEGAILEVPEVSRLHGVAAAAGMLRDALSSIRDRYPGIWEIASEIPDLGDVTRAIGGKITSEGQVDDSASEALASARRRIASLEGRLQRKLQETVKELSEDKVLQDTYVTIRSGRFVIPVKTEMRFEVPGIVHGASSTGQTVFIEPMEVLEVNNDLVTARDEEQAEIKRILTAWSALLRSRREAIGEACEILGELDLLGAIGVFGVSYGCRLAGEIAEGSAGGELSLFEARHPILEAGLRARGGSPVPLTVSFRAGGALILSGPNAGGKTVALKTIGLLSLMNQSGLPVPARDAVLPIFRQVLADIGDHQSIQASLSTFSARMSRVAEIARVLSTPALVLLDEVGAGTDPEEAGALAVSIVEHLQMRGSSVVATTHHEALKAYAEASPGARNASMETDSRMRPTFKLVPDMAGRSGGVDLAARFGLPGPIVEAARSRLSEEYRETSRTMVRLREMVEEKEKEEALIRRRREELEAQAAEQAEAARREIEALRERWREAIDAALARIDEEVERLIAGIDDRVIALQLRAESRKQTRTLREQLESALTPPAEELPPPARPGTSLLAPGTRVRVAGLREIAQVESLDKKGRAEVSFRGKRMTVRIEDLEPVPEAAPHEGERVSIRLPEGVRLDSSPKSDTAAEINLIGSTAEEARERLDKFLDDAYLAGHREVRIIHGHGTGRLRSAVRELLRGHPHVESHAPAGEREGGDGATVAILAG